MDDKSIELIIFYTKMEDHKSAMMKNGMMPMPGMMLAKLVILLIMVVAGVFLYRAWVATPQLPGDLSSDAKKAVFLTNGQVYFGDVEVANKDFLLIKNPYYLKTQTVLQEPVEEGQKAEPRQQLALTPLGAPGLQIHGPERAMYVRWDQVAYIENMTEDSTVVKTMKTDPTVNGEQPAAGEQQNAEDAEQPAAEGEDKE